MTKLTEVVAPPRVDMSCLDTLIATAGSDRLLLRVYRNRNSKVLAACQLFDFVVFESLDKAR